MKKKNSKLKLNRVTISKIGMSKIVGAANTAGLGCQSPSQASNCISAGCGSTACYSMRDHMNTCDFSCVGICC